jgi:FAD/FMN-containing dehydrogenase
MQNVERNAAIVRRVLHVSRNTSLTMPPKTGILAKLRRQFPNLRLSSDAEALAPLVKEWNGKFTGSTECAVFPRNTEEVQATVAFIGRSDTQSSIVTQGGNTGLCGGQIPNGPHEVLLCTKGLNRYNAILCCAVPCCIML